jgi:hypothetical protein
MSATRLFPKFYSLENPSKKKKEQIRLRGKEGNLSEVNIKPLGLPDFDNNSN